jgi:hypothetical protein
MKKYNDYRPYRHLNDDGRLPKSFTSKRSHAKMEGIEFHLTIDEYCSLMECGGIISSDIRPWGYHLARYGDVGPYSLNNCRFVPYLVNLREKDMTKTTAVLLEYYKTHPGTFAGKSHKEESKRKIGLANQKMKGDLNSQYGTCWITDGKNSRKIRNGSDLPEGWRLGRVNGCKPLEIARHRLS